MTIRMLMDATHEEETRVVVVRANRLEEFDFESSTKKQLKGNIYLAKVTRVEPSLQAAFVEYGGNRHGFLAFNEIHPDYYQIPVADREALLAEAARNAAEDAEQDEAEDAARSEALEDADTDPLDAEELADEDLDVIDLDADDVDNLDDVDGAAPDSNGKDVDAIDSVPVTVAFDTGPEDDSNADTSPETLQETHLAAGQAEDVYAGAVSANSDQAAAPISQETSGDDITEPGPGVVTSDEIAAINPDAADQNGTDNTPPQDLADSPQPDISDYVPPTDANGERATEAPARRTRYRNAGAGRWAKRGRRVGQNGSEDNRYRDNKQDDDAMDEVPRPRARFRRAYKIQEVIRKRQILLVQVVKEERGNKGAALTTYLSLAGRYCVLMPNTARGGGISRKIANPTARRKLKQIITEINVPDGMGVIVRTAGMNRTKSEIRRDFEYLLRLWESVRDTTLTSSAPALVYEEANLIKRAIRDLYTKEIDEVLIDGEDGYRVAKDFMRMMLPSHARKVQLYRHRIPLLHRYQVEQQLDALHNNEVQLRSGGYLVLNQTEALVAVDVNSGRSTRETNIEETALKTNLEAAEEIARQLRLRDLAGLVVIDFIDMEEHRHNRAVERKLKDCLKDDRARIQVGRISSFGLLEMSRQRLRPSYYEASMTHCPHCAGSGFVRSTESATLRVLRAIEEEGIRARAARISVAVPPDVFSYLLNQKRDDLMALEQRYAMKAFVFGDKSIVPPNFSIDIDEARSEPPETADDEAAAVDTADEDDERENRSEGAAEREAVGGDEEDTPKRKRPRRRRRRRRGEEDGDTRLEADATEEDAAEGETDREERETRAPQDDEAEADGNGRRRGRRSRRRGGRRRKNGEAEAQAGEAVQEAAAPSESEADASSPEPVATPEETIADPIDSQPEAPSTPPLEPAPPVDPAHVASAEPASVAVTEPAATIAASSEPAEVPITAEQTTPEPAQPRRRGWFRSRFSRSQPVGEAPSQPNAPEMPAAPPPSDHLESVADAAGNNGQSTQRPAREPAPEPALATPGPQHYASADAAEPVSVSAVPVSSPGAETAVDSDDVPPIPEPPKSRRRGWWQRRET